MGHLSGGIIKSSKHTIHWLDENELHVKHTFPFAQNAKDDSSSSVVCVLAVQSVAHWA